MTRYEPHCDCLGGHVSMVPDPNGRWCRADEGWQDISTAPRDKPILVWRPTLFGGHVNVSKFDTDEYANNPRPYWRSREGHIGKTEDRAHPPTHWRPLPAPPSPRSPTMPDPTDPRAVADDPSGIVQKMPATAGDVPFVDRGRATEADLRAEVERLTYEVKRLREALYDVCFEYDPSDTCQNAMVMRDIARAALSPETDGGQDG